jgi:peptide-methionine (R)-S-oxide reductase
MNPDDLKNTLTPEEYRITQEKGTETPFANAYWDKHDAGKYSCKVCGQILFASDTKLNSATGPAGLQGWPAFEDALPGSVEYVEDTSGGMYRTEVVCARCKSHLGHLFSDDTSTGKHFCINSAGLCFAEEGK